MIFSIPDYQISFPLRTDCLNTFVIENEDFLAKVVEGVQAQLLGEERGIFLYDGEKELPLPKNLRLVLNPFLMNPNDRQTLKALYQQLTEVANDEPERKAEIINWIWMQSLFSNYMVYSSHQITKVWRKGFWKIFE